MLYKTNKMTYPSTIKVAYLVEQPSYRECGYALKYGLSKLTRFFVTEHRISVLFKKQKSD